MSRINDNHYRRHIEINLLTKREIEVLQLMASELTIKEIAVHLYIGTETVVSHRKNMMRKMEARNAVGLVLRAERMGWLSTYIF